MIDPKDLQAKSDQMNAVDFVKPMVFKVVKVDYKPGDKQCIGLHFEGYEGRPYKPCLGMRRGLAQVWSDDETQWNNRLIELYVDPTVKYGGAEVGGIKVSAVSGIMEPYEFPVAKNKSQRYIHTFNPLPDNQPVAKEFIFTHHESNINEAKTSAEIDAIVQAVNNEFGGERLAELKDTVIAARARLAEQAAAE